MEILGRGEGQRDPRRGKPSEGQVSGDHHLPPPQCCPRCNSTNIKFSYFNNYNTSQPRYFCKACRRYWTQGGNLRNVPIGGGSRMNKHRRASSSSSSSSNGGREGEGERVRVELPIQPRPPQNLTGLASGILGNQSQPMGVLSPMGNFSPRGEFMPTLATMHSHLNQSPRIINQMSVNLHRVQYVGGGNMALLQRLNPQETEIQHLDEAFRPQRSMVQNLADSATTSASNTNLWNNFAAGTVPNGGGIDSSIKPN